MPAGVKDPLRRQISVTLARFITGNVCILFTLKQTVVKAGSLSGKEGDKWIATGLDNFPAEKIAAPLVAGCVGWLECRVIDEPRNQQQYDLFIGEVVAAWADPRVFHDGHWVFDHADERLRTLHYVAGGHFLVTGEAIHVDDAA